MVLGAEQSSFECWIRIDQWLGFFDRNGPEDHQTSQVIRSFYISSRSKFGTLTKMIDVVSVSLQEVCSLI